MKPVAQQGATDFIALDFETATMSRDSACAIGLAWVDGGEVRSTERHLIQPPGNVYDPDNIEIHGITPDDTADEPTFDEVWRQLEPRLRGHVLVAHHAPFDMSVFRYSLDYYGIAYPSLTFYCTRALALQCWRELPNHTLATAAQHIGVSFDHHEPTEDARACAEVALAIMRATNSLTLAEASKRFHVRAGLLFPEGWRSCKCKKPGPSRKNVSATTEVTDPSHPLYGKRVVVARLGSMTRAQATVAILNVGGVPTTKPSKLTDFVVVGPDDFKLIGTRACPQMLRDVAALRDLGSKVEFLAEGAFLDLFK